MPSYNKVILVGHLTRDPELRYAQSQTPVANMGLGINRRWKSPDGREREEVCFVECTVWGSRAEALRQYFKKGDPILVEGRLALDQWVAQDGSKRQRLYVIVEDWRFIRSLKDGGPDPFEGDRGADAYEPSVPAGGEDDDLPF